MNRVGTRQSKCGFMNPTARKNGCPVALRFALAHRSFFRASYNVAASAKKVSHVTFALLRSDGVDAFASIEHQRGFGANVSPGTVQPIASGRQYVPGFPACELLQVHCTCGRSLHERVLSPLGGELG